MHKDLPAIFARTPSLLLDAVGALSLCATFVAMLFLPGLF